MSDLRDLYQEVIVDHSKHPRNSSKIASFNHSCEGFNPLCGDKITIYLNVDNQSIKDVGFEGSGCAISTASASMMTEFIKTKKLSEVQSIFESFHKLVTGAKPEMEKLGKLAVFEGVCEFPARVKCATLAWHTLNSALKNQEPVTTES